MGLLLPSRASSDLSVFLQRPPSPFLARTLPYPLLKSYIRFLGTLYYGFKRGERATVLASYLGSLDGQITLENRDEMIKSMFRGIFDHYAEKLFFAYKPPRESYQFLYARTRITNRTVLDKMVLLGGGLLVTGHFGAVEFLAGVLASNDYRVAIIARFKTQRLKKALSKVVRYYDILAIDADEDSSLRVALRAVRSGRILVTLCDEFRDWRASKERQISIFGAIVPEDKTLNVLHARLKCLACIGLMARSEDGYELILRELADGKDCNSLSSKSWEILSEYIMKYPDQWYQWSTVAKGLATYTLKEK